MIKYCSYLLITAFLIGCSAEEKAENSNEKTTEQQQTKDTVAAIDSSTVTEPVVAKPKVEITGNVIILTTGEHHGDEIPDGVENLEWMGLFETKSGRFEWHPTSITVEACHDPCIDNEGEMSGKKVVCKDMGAYALFSGIKGLEGEFMPLDVPKNQLFPGDHLDLGTFTLEAVGDVANGRERTDPNAISNYKLMVEYEDGDTLFNAVIAHAEFFDDHMMTILLAGDLDGDGRTDYIINTTHKYSVYNMEVFLSSIAGKREFLKSVGAYRSTAC